MRLLEVIQGSRRISINVGDITRVSYERADPDPADRYKESRLSIIYNSYLEWELSTSNHDWLFDVYNEIHDFLLDNDDKPLLSINVIAGTIEG